MINLITKIPSLLGKFLHRFDDLFSSIQFKGFSTYVAGLLMQHRRTSIDSIANLTLSMNYENLQYFLSESKIDCEAINLRRVKLLEKTKPTKTMPVGVVAIDDTSCKKYGRKTEAAKVQYDSSENKLTNSNVVVLSAYCDPLKRHPLNLKPYKPVEEFSRENIDQFKSKIEFAMDLVDDVKAKGLSFSDVVFDAWYFSKELIEHIESKELSWISEAQGDRLISYQGKWRRADELATLIPSLKFTEKVTVTNSKGKQRVFRLYSKVTKIRNIKGYVKVVIAKGSWDTTDPRQIHIFVTNHLSLDAQEIVRRYCLRWGIECIIRDLKENTGFDQYQVRSLKSISRHWHFAFIAYSSLLRARLNGFFQRTVGAVKTIGDCIRAFRKLNTLAAQKWITKYREKFNAFLALNPAK